MTGQRILLIVGGGIAAYKALELVRLLRGESAEVRAILTRAGAEFVTELSLSALTEQPVRRDLFDLGQEAEMGHIQLSRWADLIVVAPATADLMAKAAAGLADDLASTTLLATDKRVLMAPAMNVRMWSHPATVRNLQRLRDDGMLFVGPDEGAMACGEWGEGRLAKPPAILAAIKDALAGPAARPLAGKRVLVTAGPTQEPIDPVRYLGNRSSGRQGYAIAAALERLGAAVTLVSGPAALPTPAGVTRVDVATAEQMLAAAQAALPADAAVFCAAVADWRAETVAPGKLKKGEAGPPALRLAETPDILRTVATGPRRPRLVVGFAAETEALETHAHAKLASKGADWIVANNVSQPGVMGGDRNTVTLITAAGAEPWEPMDKAEVARRLADRIAETLTSVVSPASVLLPHLDAARILAFYESAAGDEIRSGKFLSPESSAALAANIWGMFLNRPESLKLDELGGSPATSVTLEGVLRLPWAGGRHPCLDAVITTNERLIGVESKRYEPFRAKGSPEISDAYDRDVWGSGMRGWQAARDRARAGGFRRLDAAQLIKHALGVLEQGRRRGLRPFLLYAYAEPEAWADGRAVDPQARDEHRADIADLEALVSDDTVSFAARPYRQLLDAWAELGGPVADHARAVQASFDV